MFCPSAGLSAVPSKIKQHNTQKQCNILLLTSFCWGEIFQKVKITLCFAGPKDWPSPGCILKGNLFDFLTFVRKNRFFIGYFRALKILP